MAIIEANSENGAVIKNMIIQTASVKILEPEELDPSVNEKTIILKINSTAKNVTIKIIIIVFSRLGAVLSDCVEIILLFVFKVQFDMQIFELLFFYS